MSRLFVSFALAFALVGMGVFLLVNLIETNKAEEADISAATNDATALPQAPVAEQQPPHPVSLPALMEKKYDGRDLKLGLVLADNETYTRYYITYKSGELTISGIMNIPKGAGPFPLLVLAHGYIDPAVYTNGRGLKREQDYLARHGFAVIHPDYRNHADSDDELDPELTMRLGYTEDVINAILAVRTAKLPAVNAENVGMLGHSMGGGVAQNVMVVRPDLVKAFVLFAPVSRNVEENFKRWTERRPKTADRIVELYGSFEANPVFWNNLSPKNFFEHIAAPVLIHHGTADDSVPVEWSERLHAELQTAEKNSTLYVYPGEPHEFAGAWTEVMQKTLGFFALQLEND